MAATTNGHVRSIGLIVHDQPQCQAAEAFRSLRTSLQFLPAERLKAMIVTSSAPGEGKSTCSCNLAIALAKTGKRVLLVDADMRRPSVAATFGLPRGRGLTNLLAGRASDDDVIHPTTIDGLSVVPTGPLPPNPAELLEQPTTGEALERWRGHFDHIILDTPPALVVTDAIVVGRKVGQAVLVARAGESRDKPMQRAVGLLREAGIEILGVVLNDLAPRQGTEYGYYYQTPYESREGPESPGDKD